MRDRNTETFHDDEGTTIEPNDFRDQSPWRYVLLAIVVIGAIAMFISQEPKVALVVPQLEPYVELDCCPHMSGNQECAARITCDCWEGWDGC